MASIEPVDISSRNGHSRCLLCGKLNPRSLNLDFQIEDGVVRTIFQSFPALQGYEDILHGGVIASLLDAAMTHCLFHHGIQAATGDLHVRFLKPVPCKEVLEIQAWLLVCYPPLYRVRGEILLDRQMVAWAEAKFMQGVPKTKL